MLGVVASDSFASIEVSNIQELIVSAACNTILYFHYDIDKEYSLIDF